MRRSRNVWYGEGVTFWALGEIVKAQAGILETDSAEQVQEKLHRAVTGVVRHESEARWLERELRPLDGLTTDGTRDDRRDEATAAWRRFLEAVAENGPAVLVFDDLHWADDGLLDFVDDLVDWLRGVPLLVVGTARPELLDRREAWGGGKANATTISLPPLRDGETARLISARLGQPVQLAEDQRTLLDRAGGNPLFAEQFVRMLAVRGTAGELPELVQGIIAAPLDALPDTIGVAVPSPVSSLVQATGARGVHLHNTRNAGYANALAALDAGATLLDASCGGLGGCPYAPRPTGDIATEDLVYLLEGEGVDTDIDLDALIATSEWLEGVLGRRLEGYVCRAGPFPAAV